MSSHLAMAEIGLGYLQDPSKGIGLQKGKALDCDDDPLLSALGGKDTEQTKSAPKEKESKAREKSRQEEKDKARRERKLKEIAAKRTSGGSGSGDSQKKIVGLVLLGMLCAGGFTVVMQIVNFLKSGFVDYNIDDVDQMKEIFHSGEPWLVYCVDDRTERAAIPSQLKLAAKELSGEVNMGILHCERPQETNNMTISEQWGLTDRKAPVFLVVNFDRPRQLSNRDYASPDQIARWTRNFVEPTIVGKINPERFETECIQQPNCMILGHKTTELDKTFKKQIKDLMPEARGLRVITIDTSYWQLKLDESITNTRPKGQKKGVASVMCISKRAPQDSEESDKVYVAGFLKGDPEDIVDLRAFMQECRAPTHEYGLVDVDEVPTLARKQKKVKPSPPPPPAKQQADKPAAQGAFLDKARDELHGEWDNLVKDLDSLFEEE